MASSLGMSARATSSDQRSPRDKLAASSILSGGIRRGSSFLKPPRPPYNVEMGAVGLWEMCLSLPVPNPHNEVSGPEYDGEFKRRSILNDISVASQQTLVEEFIAGLCDLVGIG